MNKVIKKSWILTLAIFLISELLILYEDTSSIFRFLGNERGFLFTQIGDKVLIFIISILSLCFIQERGTIKDKVILSLKAYAAYIILYLVASNSYRYIDNVYLSVTLFVVLEFVGILLMMSIINQKRIAQIKISIITLIILLISIIFHIMGWLYIKNMIDSVGIIKFVMLTTFLESLSSYGYIVKILSLIGIVIMAILKTLVFYDNYHGKENDEVTSMQDNLTENIIIDN